LHCNTIVFEKDGVKVAIHGMGGVPESYAKDILYKWNPQPIQGCINILMMHQSIEPYIYSPLSPPSLSLSNLPKGFDLIIDGHLHSTGQEKIDNTLLLLPGSTIVTQQEEGEAETQKGFYFVDVGTEIKPIFVPLENNRKFFYREIKVEGSLRDQVENVLKEILSKSFAKSPLIKLKIFGNETEVVEQELREIERRYADRAIISFAKELESPEITRKIEFLRNLREQKMSVEEIGINLLRKNLDELKFNSSFDYSQAFRLLTEGKVENAFNVFTGEQKTLEMKKWMS
jgi:DNA repair exonuclease SbcCD nuclease subunit